MQKKNKKIIIITSIVISILLIAIILILNIVNDKKNLHATLEVSYRLRKSIIYNSHYINYFYWNNKTCKWAKIRKKL